MNRISHPDSQGTPQGWQIIVLCGGPYDGQQMHIPCDQPDIVLYCDTEPERYIRMSDRPIFHHESEIAAAKEGGRR